MYRNVLTSQGTDSSVIVPQPIVPGVQPRSVALNAITIESYIHPAPMLRTYLPRYHGPVSDVTNRLEESSVSPKALSLSP